MAGFSLGNTQGCFLVETEDGQTEHVKLQLADHEHNGWVEAIVPIPEHDVLFVFYNDRRVRDDVYELDGIVEILDGAIQRPWIREDK